jgi:SulP family sulfate permease
VKYSRRTFTSDLVVAMVVTIMLIPQSLAYAMLAGLPPQVGLYASMAPLLLYAVFGTSRTLAVGPVAVASLMTAAAAAQVATQGTPEYLGAAIALAAISGLMLVVMGLLRLGFLANFLSHPVIAGFITASGIQILIYGRGMLDTAGSLALASMTLFMVGMGLIAYRFGFGMKQTQRSVMALGMGTRNIAAVLAAALAIPDGDPRIVVMVIMWTLWSVVLAAIGANLFARQAPPEKAAAG